MPNPVENITDEQATVMAVALFHDLAKAMASIQGVKVVDIYKLPFGEVVRFYMNTPGVADILKGRAPRKGD